MGKYDSPMLYEANLMAQRVMDIPTSRWDQVIEDKPVPP